MYLILTAVRTDCFPSVPIFFARCALLLQLLSASSAVVRAQIERIAACGAAPLSYLLATSAYGICHTPVYKDDEPSKEENHQPHHYVVADDACEERGTEYLPQAFQKCPWNPAPE